MTCDEMLAKAKRVHFIGIGGSGMCPLAEILISEGYTVTGSDNNPGDNIEKLKSLGAKIVMGQKAENIEGADMIVFTAALLADNPELVAAKESGIPTFERAKLFGAISRMFSNCIAVCGTHGKTTTTSFISQILLENQADPTLVIGGKLPLIDSHGRAGKSDTMVCEACEFVDTFLDLSPDVAVMLNIDADHLDYFKTVENLIASFTKFASMATKAIIYNGDDERTLRALSAVPEKNNVKRISFGFSDSNDYFPTEITYIRGAFAEFNVNHHGKILGRVTLAIPGKHNILNALAAIATSLNEGIEFNAVAASAEGFRGAGRRFEILGKKNGFTVADDYAHHPAELRATLNTAMNMGFNEVWAVFQPFTFSRTSMLFDDFVKVLSIPDHTILTEIMGSRERNTFDVHSAQLCAKIPGCEGPMSFDQIADFIIKNARPGDLVITLGCGDIYKCAKMIMGK
jgi:UDP-N-acetylmuramate--alanine ligase